MFFHIIFILTSAVSLLSSVHSISMTVLMIILSFYAASVHLLSLFQSLNCISYQLMTNKYVGVKIKDTHSVFPDVTFVVFIKLHITLIFLYITLSFHKKHTHKQSKVDFQLVPIKSRGKTKQQLHMQIQHRQQSTIRDVKSQLINEVKVSITSDRCDFIAGASNTMMW